MFNPAISALNAPPVSVVQDWRASYAGDKGDLIDMSQAVPGYPAHPAMIAALEAAGCDLWAIFDAGAHYGAAYLDDAVAASRYARTPLFGRAAHFVVDLLDPGSVQRCVEAVRGRWIVQAS